MLAGITGKEAELYIETGVGQQPFFACGVTRARGL